MELNSLLFPAPSCKYTAQDLEGEIMYIPRYYKYNKMHQAAMTKLNELRSMDIGVEKSRKELKNIDKIMIQKESSRSRASA